MNACRLLVWVLIVGGILLAAVVGSRRADQGLPLDPSSPGPNGTKALVETLRVLGAKVSVSSELPSDGGTALLLADDLSEQRRTRLLDWVRQGGTLVVADPSSRVTRVEPIGDTRIGLLDAELEPTCAVPAMRDVRRVSAPGGIVFRVPMGAQGCFPRGHGAWLVVQPTGSGTVVRLGGASALVNQRINRTDNAVLIVGLLSPAPGPEVVVLRPPPPGGGSKGLSDLIAPRVKLTLVQLVVAFLLLALWRSRRLGRPVTEPTAVRIPGSELVVAVGNLLRRARRRSRWPGRSPSEPGSTVSACWPPSNRPPRRTTPSWSRSPRPSTPSVRRSPVPTEPGSNGGSPPPQSGSGQAGSALRRGRSSVATWLRGHWRPPYGWCLWPGRARPARRRPAGWAVGGRPARAHGRSRFGRRPSRPPAPAACRPAARAARSAYGAGRRRAVPPPVRGGEPGAAGCQRPPPARTLGCGRPSARSPGGPAGGCATVPAGGRPPRAARA